jgi:periodic tryptophan protein 2
LDIQFVFDPFDLDIDITPANILTTLDAAKKAAETSTPDEESSFLKALVMSFRLNEAPLIRAVYEGIPHTDIPHVVRPLPTVYIPRLLRFVANFAEETPHLEFNLLWIESLLSIHGRYLKDNTGTFATELRAVQRVIDDIQDNIKRMTERNLYELDYLLAKPVLAGKKPTNGVVKIIDESEPVTDRVDEHMDDAHGVDDGEGEWIGLE